ncbi:MAG: hypothetical protein C4308_01155 [Chitinophagaceae bacterium]
MKGILTERNIIVVLFVLVMITFSLAQKETQKMEKLYYGVTSKAGSILASTTASHSSSVINN